MRVPSALPEGEPAPSDGSLPDSALAGVGRAAVRGLRARAVLHGPLRLLRLQHLHGRRPRHRDRRARRLPDDVRRRRGRGGPAGAAGARRRRSPVETVFFGGGTPDAAQPGRPRRGAGRDRRRARAGAGRRGDHRGEPGQRHQGRPGRAARGAASPGSRSGCSRRSTTCSRSWTAPTTRPGCPTWWRGRARPASSRSAWT